MANPAIKRAWLGALLAVVSASFLLTVHLGVFLFPGAVCLIALALPPSLGLTSRLLASLTMLFAGNVAVATLGFPLQPLGLALLWFVPAGAAAGHRGMRASVGQLTFEDGLITAVASLTSAYLLLPWASRDVTGQLALMQPGEDNASHLGIVTGIRYMGGLIYGSSQQQLPGLIPGLRTYPQGAHVNVGIVADVVYGKDGGLAVANTVQAYSFAILFAMAVLVVALSVLAVQLAQAVQASKAAWCLAAGAPVAAVLGGPGFWLFYYGFFTQIVAYGAFAVLCLIAVDPRWNKNPWWRLTVAACSIIAIASTFYFLLPTLMLTIFAIMRQDRKTLRSDSLRALILFTFTASLSIPHVLSSLTNGATAAVNADGGVHTLNPSVLALMLAGAGLFLVYSILRGVGETVSTWAWSLVAASVFSLAFRQYQLLTVGESAYYFQKSLFTIYVLACVGVGALSAVLVGTATRSRLMATIVTPLTALGLVLLLATQSTQGDHDLGRVLHADERDDGFAHALTVRSSPGLLPVVFWRYSSGYSDYLKNRQLGALFLQEEPTRFRAILDNDFDKDTQALVALVRLGRGLVVITRDSQLRSYLAGAGLSDKELATVRIQLIS